MADVHPNILLVEGKQDLRVIPELIEANGVAWGNRRNPVVLIRDLDGYENLINPEIIATELKASGLRALGIIIDADESPASRWSSIRNACLKSIPTLPEVLPLKGLIHTTSEGIRFGIWMMPDNQMRGMLETFLSELLPEQQVELWQYAQETVQASKHKGAAFKDTHLDKANIYTWLAWQAPPGRQLHQAIMEKILDPRHPKSQAFVTWFKTLYTLN
jgi:hypothetical protein